MKKKPLNVNEISNNIEIKSFLHESLSRASLVSHHGPSNILVHLKELGWIYDTSHREEYLLFTIPDPQIMDIHSYSMHRNNIKYKDAFIIIYKFIVESEYSDELIGCVNYSDLPLYGKDVFENIDIVSFYHEKFQSDIIRLKNCDLHPGNINDQSSFTITNKQVILDNCKISREASLDGADKYTILNMDAADRLIIDNHTIIDKSIISNIYIKGSAEKLIVENSIVNQINIDTNNKFTFFLNSASILRLQIVSKLQEMHALNTKFGMLFINNDSYNNGKIYLDKCSIADESIIHSPDSFNTISIEECNILQGLSIKNTNIDYLNISNSKLKEAISLTGSRLASPPRFFNNEIVVNDMSPSKTNSIIEKIIYGLKPIEEYYAEHKELERYAELKVFTFDSMHLYLNRYTCFDLLVNSFFRKFTNYGLSLSKPMWIVAVLSLIHLSIHTLTLFAIGYRIDISSSGFKMALMYLNNLFNSSPFTIVFDRVRMTSNSEVDTILAIVDGFTGVGISFCIFFALLTLRRRYQIS